MKALKIVLVGALVALAGCKAYVTKDGKIPAELVEASKKYEGAYNGQFNKNEGVLSLENVDGKAVASFSMDLLADGCDSKIGQLERVVTLTKTTFELEFAFDAGKCSEEVQGKYLLLQVVDKDGGVTVKASVIERSYVRYQPGCYPPIPGGGTNVLCPGQPTTEYTWLSGSFRK